MRNLAILLLILFSLVAYYGCNRQADEAPRTNSEDNTSQLTDTTADPTTIATQNAPPATTETENPQPATEEIHVTKPNYPALHRKIMYGDATLYEMRQALTEENALGLTNTIHALYSMRWHREALHVLEAMWGLNRDKYPELAWDLIEKAPARIALASTLNRINPHNTEYKDYIRSYMHSEQEFDIAQVVVALGLSGNPQDAQYLKDKAESDSSYIAQSAITGLALLNHVQGRDALIELHGKHMDDAKGKVILDVLEKAYNWTPEKKPEEKAGTEPAG